MGVKITSTAGGEVALGYVPGCGTRHREADDDDDAEDEGIVRRVLALRNPALLKVHPCPLNPTTSPFTALSPQAVPNIHALPT